jgi:hypothetical protein
VAAVNVFALSNSYASTTNPTYCTLSYQLKNSAGTTYSSTSSPVKIDSSGKVYITQNSAFTLTLYIVVTSTYFTASNSFNSNNFQIQMINCQPSISGISTKYQYYLTPSSANIQVLSGNLYSTTNNPSNCKMTYQIYNSDGTFASNNSQILFD